VRWLAMTGVSKPLLLTCSSLINVIMFQIGFKVMTSVLLATLLAKNVSMFPSLNS
jgi:hypothetical protein